MVTEPSAFTAVQTRRRFLDDRSGQRVSDTKWPPEGGHSTLTAWAVYFINLASALPRSAGDFTVVTPAFSSAANFAAAVPLPPEMIAPA